MNRSLAAAAMDRAETALAAYYDHEAQARSNRALDPRRIVLRDEFVAMLAAEGRSRVVEVGTGPGRDGAAFIQAGLQVAGVDISSEHVRLARAAGVDAVCASLFDLPYPLSSFDAGWTMSTLVHVEDARFHAAMDAICSVLREGAPLAVGLWGGLDHEGVSDRDEILPPRFFSLRTHARTRAMLGQHGEVERFETWPSDRAGGWEYQWAVLRVRPGASS
ncbi:MAG: class I SAM-dependent methyltransferase [Actinomycetota bacterium]|nr:class I SAM-dependent methyltransferase [Actinomycetota bacterium]